jgi:putative SOS response-associated peptidase YedK
MCGRFAINLSAAELENAFQVEFDSQSSRDQFHANHNIKPSQQVPIIQAENPRQINLAHWGFVGKIRNPNSGQTQEKLFINARGETLDQKRSFKPAWANGQRCLFLMSHFYEWMGTSKGKVPFAIALRSHQPMAVAGLYQEQKVQDQLQIVTTLITTSGNHLMQLVHNQGSNKGRMPVILSPEEQQEWLDPNLPLDDVKGLLKTYPDDALETYPVNKSLDSPASIDFKEKRALEFYASQYGFKLAG